MPYTNHPSPSLHLPPKLPSYTSPLDISCHLPISSLPLLHRLQLRLHELLAQSTDVLHSAHKSNLTNSEVLRTLDESDEKEDKCMKLIASMQEILREWRKEEEEAAKRKETREAGEREELKKEASERKLTKREKRMMMIEKYANAERREVEKSKLVALAKQARERNSVWGQREREDSDELSGELTDNDFHVDVYGGMGLEDDDL
jgi:hypothetical protein